jgi:REP element-mobilizing transposase RayT
VDAIACKDQYLVMVIAAHIIFTARGFWLPNDPRGSWSDFVAAWELVRFGKANKVTTRRSLAKDPHDVELRRAAKLALKYPPVRFDGHQALSVARGFARACSEGGYAVHACSILHDHVHLVVRRHQRLFEQITGPMKGRATQQLRADGIHPYRGYAEVPSPWAESLWKVFCDNDAHVNNAIDYVEQKPITEGNRAQRWSFVVPSER